MTNTAFLSTFTRSNINYFDHHDNAIQDAYKSGIHDATINYIKETTLKITGKSQTLEEVKKCLRQVSYNSELSLKDNQGNAIKTPEDQELLADNWFKQNPQSGYTQFVIMIPKDNNREKLAKIAQAFFSSELSNQNYIYVEHADTNIYHYHVIVQKSYNPDIEEKWRLAFIKLCIAHDAKLL